MTAPLRSRLCFARWGRGIVYRRRDSVAGTVPVLADLSGFERITVKTLPVDQAAPSLFRASAVRGKLRQRTVSLYRSMSYGLFCPGTI